MSYNHPPRLVSLFTTTLSNSIGSGASEAITLESTARLTQGELVTLTIDRIDSNGNTTLDQREVVQGIVSGNTITDVVRGYDGTSAQAHSVGAVVEMILVAADWNKIVDAVGNLNSLITNEIPSGSINGSNKTFTLQYEPDEHGLLLFYNTSLLKEAIIPAGGSTTNVQGDYTIDGKTITMDFAPQSGSTLLATYKLLNPSDGGGGGGSREDIEELWAAIEELEGNLTSKVDKELKTGSEDTYKVLSDNNYSDEDLSRVATIPELIQQASAMAVAIASKANASDIPTKTSDLTNDSKFVVDANYTHITVDDALSASSQNPVQNQVINQALSNKANNNDIPTKTSDLTNDSGFITSANIPTKTSDLTNDSHFVADSSYTHTDNNYTTTEKTKLAGIDTGAQVNVIEKITLNGTEQTVTDKTVALTDTTYQAFAGTDGSTAGTSGLVPAPVTTDSGKYLKSDGTWATPNGGGGGGADILEVQVFS